MNPPNGQMNEKSPPAQGLPHPATMPNQAMGFQGQWSTGLCDCCADPSNCCITWCCPCMTFGQIAEVVDKGTTSCGLAGLIYYALASVGCACLYTSGYRAKLRAEYQLEEAPCGDCLVHWCCTACALCQEYRELKIRGVDPSIGECGKVERERGGGNSGADCGTGNDSLSS